MAKPSRQQPSPSVAPCPRPAVVASMSRLWPAGRVSTQRRRRCSGHHPGSSNHQQNRRCGEGRFFGDFLVATDESHSPAGAGPANHRQPTAPQNQTAKSKALDPGLRRVRRGSLPTAMPRDGGTTAAGNGEAEPADLPLLQRRCSPRPAELSRRCLSPPGRFRRDPSDAGGARTGESRRCGRGASLVTFSSPQESHSPAGARPGQSPPTEGTSKTKRQDQNPGPRPAPGRQIVSGGRASSSGTARRRQWRSRAGERFPLLQRRVQPAAGGNCRVDV